MGGGGGGGEARAEQAEAGAAAPAVVGPAVCDGVPRRRRDRLRLGAARVGVAFKRASGVDDF